MMARLYLGAVFGLDLRSLAAARVLLGCVVCWVVADYMQDVDMFFSDNGSSLYYTSGDPAVVFILLCFHLAINAAWTIGYKTQVMGFLNWFMYLQLSRRLPVLNYGADTVMHYCLFWASFLPMGARCSLDALLKRAAWLQSLHGPAAGLPSTEGYEQEEDNGAGDGGRARHRRRSRGKKALSVASNSPSARSTSQSRRRSRSRSRPRRKAVSARNDSNTNAKSFEGYERCGGVTDGVVLSVSSFGFSFNWALMYVLAGALKLGPSWRSPPYNAVLKVFTNEFYTGGFISQQARLYPGLLAFFTQATLLLECYGPLLLLLPALPATAALLLGGKGKQAQGSIKGKLKGSSQWGQWLRLLVLLSFQGMQSSFMFTMHLGFFPFVCTASHVCMLPPLFWRLLLRLGDAGAAVGGRVGRGKSVAATSLATRNETVLCYDASCAAACMWAAVVHSLVDVEGGGCVRVRACRGGVADTEEGAWWLEDKEGGRVGGAGNGCAAQWVFLLENLSLPLVKVLLQALRAARLLNMVLSGVALAVTACGLSVRVFSAACLAVAGLEEGGREKEGLWQWLLKGAKSGVHTMVETKAANKTKESSKGGFLSPVRRLLRKVANGAQLYALFLVTFSNASCYWRKYDDNLLPLPTEQQHVPGFTPVATQLLLQHANAVGLGQDFGMFAPEPAYNDGWFNAVATLKNGDTIDLTKAIRKRSLLEHHATSGFPNGKWRPQPLANAAPSMRWHALYSKLRYPQFAWLTCELARALCISFNTQHTGQQQALDILWSFTLEQILQNSTKAPPKEITLWHHTCPHATADAWTECWVPHPDLAVQVDDTTAEPQATSAGDATAANPLIFSAAALPSLPLLPVRYGGPFAASDAQGLPQETGAAEGTAMDQALAQAEPEQVGYSIYAPAAAAGQH